MLHALVLQTHTPNHFLRTLLLLLLRLSGTVFAPPQLLVMFKPGTDKAKKDNALGKGNAEETMVVQRGDDASGDISLVKVKMLPDQATKGQLKAAAAQIKNGGYVT
jgi:hypothetical protein